MGGRCRQGVPLGAASGECEYAAARRGLGPDGDDDFTAALLGLGAPRRPSRGPQKERSRWRLVESLTRTGSPDHKRRGTELSTSPGVTPISMRMLREIDQRIKIPAPTQEGARQKGGEPSNAAGIAVCLCSASSSRRESLEEGATRTSSCASAASTPRCGPADPCANICRGVASLTSLLGDAPCSSWNSDKELQSSLDCSSRTSSSSSSSTSSRIPRQAHIKPPRHIAKILSVSLSGETACDILSTCPIDADPGGDLVETRL